MDRNDYEIGTSRIWLDEKQTECVFKVWLKHIQTGIITFARDKVQKKAYEVALKELEEKVEKSNKVDDNCSKLDAMDLDDCELLNAEDEEIWSILLRDEKEH